MKTDFINDFLKDHLTEKRQIHTEGVRKTAVYLAEKYGADPEKAGFAALCHDMYRSHSDEELNQLVKRFGLDDRYLNSRNLSHGKIAACSLREDFGIDDMDIINAIRYHTTGREGMSLLEKIIYIADAIEPGRNYPGVEKLREAAEKDLDLACYLSLSNTVNFVRGQGAHLDEDTLKARDSLFRPEFEKISIKGEN